MVDMTDFPNLDDYKLVEDAARSDLQVENNIADYIIFLTDEEAKDINAAADAKKTLAYPYYMADYIWNFYIKRKMQTLCGRILGDEPVSGIYKITDVFSGETYIGKGVNIAERWRTHVKNALRSTSATPLSQAMRRDSITAFTFQLVCKAPAEILDTLEHFYIKLYKSNIYGLNVVK